MSANRYRFLLVGAYKSSLSAARYALPRSVVFLLDFCYCERLVTCPRSLPVGAQEVAGVEVVFCVHFERALERLDNRNKSANIMNRNRQAAPTRRRTGNGKAGRLVVDVLNKIFEQGRGYTVSNDRLGEYLPFEMAVSHTIRYCGTQWDSVYASLYIIEELPKMYLERSKTRPIDVMIDCRLRTRKKRQAETELVLLIVPHIYRTRSLKFMSTFRSGVPEILSPLTTISAPYLQSLGIDIFAEAYLAPLDLPTIFSDGLTPRLTALELHAALLPHTSPSLSAITTLTLGSHHDDPYILWSEFRNMILSMPHLETLNIVARDTYRLPMDVRTGSDVLRISALKSLTLSLKSESNKEWYLRVSSLIDAIAAPNLVTLDLEGLHATDALGVMGYLSLSGGEPKFPELRSFSLRNIALRIQAPWGSTHLREDHLSLPDLGGLSRVTHIALLDLSHAQALWQTLLSVDRSGIGSQPSAWAGLDTMTVSMNMEVLTWMELVVRGRLEADWPLRKVQIVRANSQTQPDEVEMHRIMESLQQLVEVEVLPEDFANPVEPRLSVFAPRTDDLHFPEVLGYYEHPGNDPVERPDSDDDSDEWPDPGYDPVNWLDHDEWPANASD